MALSKYCDAWQFKTLGQMDFWTANTTGGYLVGFKKNYFNRYFQEIVDSQICKRYFFLAPKKLKF